MNCRLIAADFFLFISPSSERVSEERGRSGAAQTWEEEGEEEKECKTAAASSGTEPGHEPNTARYHRPDRGHPRPAAAKRSTAGADREASEDRY